MILAQQTHGKSTKIIDGLEKELVKGLILSPAHTNPKLIESEVKKYQELNAFIIFDTQFQYEYLNSNRVNHSYDFTIEMINDDIIIDANELIIKRRVSFQQSLGLEYITIPSIFVNDLNTSKEGFIFKQFCKYSKDYVSSGKLLLTFALDEDALISKTKVDDWLNYLTTLNWLKGFVVFIRRGDMNKHKSLDPEKLSMLMYICHILKENGFEFHYTHADIEGLLLSVSGADSFAYGWNAKGNIFTSDNLYRVDGKQGRPPSPKYLSNKLFYKLRGDTDLSSLFNFGEVFNSVLSENEYDENLKEAIKRRDFDSYYTTQTRIFQCWSSLGSLEFEINEINDIHERVELLYGKLQNARTILNQLKNEEIILPYSDISNHISNLLISIDKFRQLID